MITRHFHLLCVALSCLLIAQPPVRAAGQLVIYPPSVQIDQRNDLQRLIVIHTREDGLSRDVTAESQMQMSSADVAVISADGMVRAVADGQALVSAHFGDLTAQAAVIVEHSAIDRPVSFRHDIEPVLMKAGCNSGSCHGNARGQEGFRLSLFGFDPQMDYLNLTRQNNARRINLAHPHASLILQKPLTEVRHGGGRRFAADSTLHDLLVQWLEAGTPDDPDGLPALVGIELLPRESVLLSGGQTQQLLLQARYADGSDRDVTPLAVFSTLNEASAGVSDGGQVRTGDRGEAFIMARFGTFSCVTQIIVIDDRPPDWPEGLEPQSIIDEEVFAKQKKLRLRPSPRCEDSAFLRRVSLDITGVLPTVAETRAFLEDTRPDKRARLIDDLLQRPEFPELWAMKWADLLRIESEKLTKKGVYLYSSWLRDAIQRDVRMDKLVRQLLTAEGGNFHLPAANFYVAEEQPNLIAENVAQVFTGIRIQCAQCHNHPFDRWTQDDYYSLAAFFGQIGRKTAEDPRETIIYNRHDGEVKHLRTGRVMKPKFLGGAYPAIQPGQDRRAVFAQWLTAADNPWFARNLANRVWAHFFGRGLVEPPDDVRISNPASHPQLLEALASKLIENGYDLRALVRDICNSQTYQLATATDANRHDRRNFSHALIRRLPAEQLLDALTTVTGVSEKFSGLPLGARAVQIADARSGSYFLETFGRPIRQSVCTCERRSAPTLSQALHLITGATVWSKVRSDGGRLNQLLSTNTSPADIVEELYLASLCRKPQPQEMEAALAYIEKSNNPREGLEDLLWALLNSQEFVFNH